MTIGIMGLGYVGLPLAVAFAEEGHHVIALDTDARKVEAIRARDSYIEDIPSERLAAVADRIEATRHAQPLARCDAVLICVPTPLTANRETDLGPLVSATRRVAAAPGHAARDDRPAARRVGPRGRPRLPPRVLARARGPGPHRLHAANH